MPAMPVNAIAALFQGLILSDPEAGNVGPVVDLEPPNSLNGQAAAEFAAEKAIAPDRAVAEMIANT
ncbi:hypothetical protein OSCI_1140014 [Kamptonema sp. PCC 6506]|nr:hypothetical protein OSCI_1140014 [Kamptonema sp. PCC 6506]